MYKLVKIIALNFGNMVQRDYQFSGDLTLISGANGSGKSTLEDLVQCVMTGDTKNIVNYNAGQKEDTTKKHNETQRSFASYILGGEELRFTREQALGVAALVFKNRVTGKIFTAWLYGEAELTGKKGEEIAKGGVKELGFCYNAQLDSNDFLIGENPNGDIKQPKELRDYFEKKYKRDLYICDKKEEYIMKLYASFNDKTSIPYSDAKAVAKAFVKYIYPTKADNVNNFVKEELLDKNDLSHIVKDLRESINTYSRIQKEAEAIAKSEEELSVIIKENQSILNSWKEYYNQQYIFHKRDFYRNLEYQSEKENNIQRIQKDIQIIENTLSKIPTKIEKLHDELSLLEKKLEDNEKIQKRNELLEERKNLEQNLDELKLKIKMAFDSFSNGYSILNSANQILPIKNYCQSDILQFLAEINKMKNDDLDKKLTNCENISNELKSLLAEKSNYYESFEKTTEDLTQDYKDKYSAYSRIKSELETFTLTGKQHYPNQKDIEIIKECFPDSNPIPLCELLDIKDRKWQGAIEGFLGRNRFSIIVDEDFEVEVTDLLKYKGLTSKVIQGKRVINDYERQTREIKHNSIVNLFTFKDKTAEAYIRLNYGNVLQYDNTESLTKASRGIKKDGLAANGYATFKCGLDEKDCYIGEATRIERHHRLVQDELKLRSEINISEIKKIKANETKNKILKLTIPNIGQLSLEYRNLNEDLKVNNDLIKAIDISNEEMSLKRITVIREAIDNIKKEEKENIGNLAVFNERINNINGEIALGKSKFINLEKILTESAVIIKNITKTLGDLKFDEHLEYLSDFAKQTFRDTEQPFSFHDRVTKKLFDLEIRNNDYIKNCAQLAIINEMVLASTIKEDLESFNKLFTHYIEQKNVYEELSKNVLSKKNNEVMKHKEEFHKIFRGEFCAQVYNSIRDGDNKKNHLNRILRKNKFGNESFLIKSEFTSKYKKYYDYFEFVTISGESDQLGLIPNELNEVKEMVDKMLLDTNDEKAIGELKAISDYRNFKEYDIHKVIGGDEENSKSLTRSGTDSGGQATTSYYIIRSIAAFSAFSNIGTRASDSGLGFLMIDEAFSKIDEHRTGDIIRYLTQTLGFQLIAATPTDKEAAMVKYATDRYQVYKQIVNPSYENYEVKQYYDRFILNKERIEELLNNDEKIIRQEQGFLEI